MADHPLQLLDTNVLVALIRAGALGQYIDATYQLRQARFKPLISVVSVGEIYSLARQLEWGPKNVAEVAKLLDNLVVEDINVPEILVAYGEIDYASRKIGRRMGKNDVWIAATARVSGATLLTSDHDFDHLSATHALYKPDVPAINLIWIDPALGTPAP
ncbi:MAG: type II toxin-antitoxin system VapC family toxin [Phycisphaerales bacterium]|jgi:predicted nucleic acid-binding protein|nr:type II toxin-antitoxin system VapC family toxin [Phycisphaerales bacterium]